MLCYLLQPNMPTVCIGALHAFCNFGTTAPVGKAKMEKISSSTSVGPTSTSLELEKEEGIAMIVPSLLEHYLHYQHHEYQHHCATLLLLLR